MAHLKWISSSSFEIETALSKESWQKLVPVIVIIDPPKSEPYYGDIAVIVIS